MEIYFLRFFTWDRFKGINTDITVMAVDGLILFALLGNRNIWFKPYCSIRNGELNPLSQDSLRFLELKSNYFDRFFYASFYLNI